MHILGKVTGIEIKQIYQLGPAIQQLCGLSFLINTLGMIISPPFNSIENDGG